MALMPWSQISDALLLLQHAWMRGVWPFRNAEKAKEIAKQAEQETMVRRLWLKLIREGKLDEFQQAHERRHHHGSRSRCTNFSLPATVTQRDLRRSWQAEKEAALMDAAREHVRALTFPEYYMASLQWRVRLVHQAAWIVAALLLFAGICASPRARPELAADRMQGSASRRSHTTLTTPPGTLRQTITT